MKLSWCLSLFLLACGSNQSGPPVGQPLDPGNAVELSNTTASLAKSYSLHIDGGGLNELGAISIQDGVGTLEFKGTVAPAVNLWRTSGKGLGSPNVTLYQIMAVQSDRLILLWAYCSNHALVGIYYETTDGIFTDEDFAPEAPGTCTADEVNVTETLQLPPTELQFPDVVKGFSANGSQLQFSSGFPGQVVTAGQQWTLYPFNAVDCTACASPGWYELHSLFWNAEAKTACLGIFYLTEGEPNTVGLSYFACLGDGTLTTKEYVGDYGAIWTHF